MEPSAIQNIGVAGSLIDFSADQPLLIAQQEFKRSSRGEDALKLSPAAFLSFLDILVPQPEGRFPELLAILIAKAPAAELQTAPGLLLNQKVKKLEHFFNGPGVDLSDHLGNIVVAALCREPKKLFDF